MLQTGREAAVDPIDLEHRFRSGFVMVVDGRDANVALLQRMLHRVYRVQLRPRFRNTVFYLVDALNES